MTELIRRLDHSRFEVHVASFHRRGAWLARAEEHAASVAEFPITGFRRASTFTAGAPVRGVVPRARDRARPHDRPLRQHLRPAGRGDGRRAGADRQPPRDQPRQVAGADRAAAGGVRAARTWSSPTPPLPATGWRRNACPARASASSRTGSTWRAYTPSAHDRPIRRIVTVANLRPEKAHEVLFEAAASWCCGAAPTRSSSSPATARAGRSSKRWRAARGIASRVQFLGHADDVPALLASSDLFVLPSRSEAFPEQRARGDGERACRSSPRASAASSSCREPAHGRARAAGRSAGARPRHPRSDSVAQPRRAARARGARRGRSALLVGTHGRGVRAPLHRAAWRARADVRLATELMAS